MFALQRAIGGDRVNFCVADAGRIKLDARLKHP